MKMINIQRVLHTLGIVGALTSIYINFGNGYMAWSWQLACILWILNSWMKTEEIQSSNK